MLSDIKNRGSGCHGLVVSASARQSGGPRFKSCWKRIFSRPMVGFSTSPKEKETKWLGSSFKSMVGFSTLLVGDQLTWMDFKEGMRKEVKRLIQ